MRLTLALALLAGCSVLVEPPDRVRCDPPGGLVCGPNAICGSEGADLGYCVDLSCEMGQEICDGLDNDCDGSVDEELADRAETCDAEDDDCDGSIDEGLDEDGDGYTPCGTTDCMDPDGMCRLDPDNIDCNDGLSNVNPAAPELCDAIDHDCDGSAVPPGDPDPITRRAPRDVLCADPTPLCEPTAGCVRDDCTAPRTGAGCRADQLCDPSSGGCVTVGCTQAECAALGDFFCSLGGDCERRRGPGEDCNDNPECASGICANPAALGLSRVGPKVCVQPCCLDNDCSGDQFCWDPGTGTRSCVPVDFEPALHGRAQLGTRPGGSSCSAGRDCRSGLCGASGVCLATCRGVNDCGSGAECTLLRRADNAVIQACIPGLRRPGDRCGSDNECPYLVCDFRIPPFDYICTLSSCATDADCGGGECQYRQFNTEPYMFTLCVSDADRQGACCSSSQCGAGQVCRPQLSAQASGQLFPMFCDPG